MHNPGDEQSPGFMLAGSSGQDPSILAIDETTHAIPSTSEAPMGPDQGDKMLEQMQALLVKTREQLGRAVEEVEHLQTWSDDEEEARNAQSGPSRADDLSEEALARMTAREREAAIKRARNREAARRSRQRKNERINQLYRDIKTLQQENLLLLKCIEDFTQKAIACKEEQIEMKEQLASLGGPPANPEQLDVVMEDAQPQPEVPERRSSPVGSLALPSFEELQRLSEEVPKQLTARSGNLSARGSALNEHIAMLSKENSPRDDELPGGAGAGGAAGAAAAANAAGSSQQQLQVQNPKQ